MIHLSQGQHDLITNRRRHERFLLPPAYTEVAARLMDEGGFEREGHAYDLSEGGIMFEMDRPIAPGSEVNLRITLPGIVPASARSRDGIELGPGRAVFVVARVIWTDDDEVNGPVRMAAAFTRFCRVGDRERLLQRLQTGRYARAA